MLQDTWHKIEVELSYGELTPLLKWVQDNCSSNWNYDIIESAGREAGIYQFLFKEDKDAVAFTLWKT